MRVVRSFLLPCLAVLAAAAAVWYAHRPAPIAASSPAQVRQEAEAGGYRLMDADTLAERALSGRENILLVDTRQEWEHRAGHIRDSVLFPMTPTRWAQWRAKGALERLLGPDKAQTIVFY